MGQKASKRVALKKINLFFKLVNDFHFRSTVNMWFMEKMTNFHAQEEMDDILT